MKILATGPSGPPEELNPLSETGHEVIIGRPLDQPGRKAYTEAPAHLVNPEAIPRWRIRR